MIPPPAIRIDAQSALGPIHALLEVLLHEIANPLQAVQSTLRSWRDETPADAAFGERLERVDTSIDRVATVLRIVQSIKDDALTEPTATTSEKLMTDLAGECRAAGIEMALVSDLLRAKLRLHGTAIPILVVAWLRTVTTAPALARMTLRYDDDTLLLTVRTRIGADNSVRYDLTATSAAGYAAAIGEFLRSAGGSAAVAEDDLGAYELALRLPTWPRDEMNRWEHESS